MYRFKNKKGIALIFVFIVMTALSGIAFAFLFMVRHEVRSSGAGLRNAQAFYIAEAGLAKARWALGTGEAVGWGETDEPFGEGTYTVTTVVDNEEDGTYKITSKGYVPDSVNSLARRMVTESSITVNSNLSLGADASASSAQNPNVVASKANDDNTGTKWQSKDDNGSWLRLDFGSSTTFDKVVIYDFFNFDSYTIEYSDDDVTYQEVVIIPSELPTILFNSVTARYLRLNVNGNRPEVSEFETYDIAGGGKSLGQGEFSTIW